MNFLLVVLAYVFCHGLTAYAVTPVQSLALPETTIFASFVYLPHGVRVLATWAFRWQAVPALIVGSVLSNFLFTPVEVREYLESAVLPSIALGSLAALVAFELARFLGKNVYAGRTPKIRWTGLLLVGGIASVVNSAGQTFVYSGLIGFERLGLVLVTYAIGDLVGLFVCMTVLMLIFRWVRLAGHGRQP